MLTKYSVCTVCLLAMLLFLISRRDHREIQEIQVPPLITERGRTLARDYLSPAHCSVEPASRDGPVENEDSNSEPDTALVKCLL